MNELRYEIRTWEEDGRRHLRMKVNLLVKPYVRQTRTTRWRDDESGERARQYNETQGTLRDAVTLILLKEGISSFGKTKLGFASWFWLCPKKVFRVKKNTWIDDPSRCDLNNLEKAIEDALNGAMYPDDVWIWKRERGFKMLGEDDWFAVHVWELSDDEFLELEEWVA